MNKNKIHTLTLTKYDLTKYEPLTGPFFPHEPGPTDVARVIMVRLMSMDTNEVTDGFEIHVGNNKSRMFTKDTLPDDIKFQLAMIHSIDWEKYKGYEETLEETLLGLDLFVLPPLYPTACEEFGWMRYGNIYVLVLPKKVLEELQGQVPHG